jgi:methylthioribose-1-phosphate isomerase
MLTPVERSAAGVRLLDQRRLPRVESYVDCASAEEVAQAIRDMVVRGAPAIGIAAGFALALGATQAIALPPADFDRRLDELVRMLREARPTAVSLRRVTERMAAAARGARGQGLDNATLAHGLEHEARAIRDEDLAACRAMGRHGACLVPDGSSVLTHCNAGALATAGFGTALGVVRQAVANGKRIRVLVDETRPFLQGSRLTAWELVRDGIETVLITDGMSGSLMRSREVDLVIVGADRIAANGDTANKIGTYSVAVLAQEHDLPFYVAAPVVTIDLDCATGDEIPIEERDPGEVTSLGGVQVAPDGVRVRNPAFDITPARYIAAFITEHGIARPPFGSSLPELVAAAKQG